jgi:hypothetical protein
MKNNPQLAVALYLAFGFHFFAFVAFSDTRAITRIQATTRTFNRSSPKHDSDCHERDKYQHHRKCH